jgi:hypothetical protein
MNIAKVIYKFAGRKVRQAVDADFVTRGLSIQAISCRPLAAGEIS